MKNIHYLLLAAITLIGSTVSAQNKNVIDMGGMGLAEAIDETHFVAALTGEFSGAYAEIISQKETPTGLELVMQHYFVNDDNGLIRTRDKAILTAVQGKPDTYMLEIDYTVQETRGIYDGYSGEFHSYGLIKIGEGQVVLRYKGKLTKP